MLERRKEMRKIKDNKVYDTDTANFIGKYEEESYSINDSHYFEEILFRKRTGEYFIYGTGGKLSKYAKKISGGFTPGDHVFALTFEEARKWAEEHLEPAEYKAEFEICDESDEKIVVSFSIPKGVLKKLKIEARTKGLERSACLSEILKKELG